MTFKEAYTLYYEYQKDKIKDSTLKTYRDRIKYMGLLDNIEFSKFELGTLSKMEISNE